MCADPEPFLGYSDNTNLLVDGGALELTDPGESEDFGSASSSRP